MATEASRLREIEEKVRGCQRLSFEDGLALEGCAEEGHHAETESTGGAGAGGVG